MERPSGNGASVVAPGARLEKLAGGFDFTEGPTCDTNGNLFFTDQPNDRILRWSAQEELSTFLQPAGRANGMYFDRGGHLIVCADERNELWSIAPNGAVSVLAGEYGAKRFNGPNDVWARPDSRPRRAVDGERQLRWEGKADVHHREQRAVPNPDASDRRQRGQVITGREST